MGKSESRQFCNENIKDGKGSERVGVGRKLAGGRANFHLGNFWADEIL